MHRTIRFVAFAFLLLALAARSFEAPLFCNSVDQPTYHLESDTMLVNVTGATFVLSPTYKDANGQFKVDGSTFVATLTELQEVNNSIYTANPVFWSQDLSGCLCNAVVSNNVNVVDTLADGAILTPPNVTRSEIRVDFGCEASLPHTRISLYFSVSNSSYNTTYLDTTNTQGIPLQYIYPYVLGSSAKLRNC